MNEFEKKKTSTGSLIENHRLRIRTLEERAQELEAEAANLMLRVVGLDEEDSAIANEIASHRAEIARLSQKLEGVNADRQHLLETIEGIKKEVAAVKEQSYESEAEIALSVLEDVHDHTDTDDRSFDQAVQPSRSEDERENGYETAASIEPDSNSPGSILSDQGLAADSTTVKRLY